MTAEVEFSTAKSKMHKLKSSYLSLNENGEVGIKYVVDRIVFFQKVEKLIYKR